MRKLIISFILCCITVLYSFGQSLYLESNANITDNESLARWKDRYEILEEISQHPFNINTITKDQLEELPFLSDQLITNILSYIEENGPLLSKNELIAIKGMDYTTRKFMEEFIFIGPEKGKTEKVSFKKIFLRSKNEFSTRVDIPLNEKAGYVQQSKEILEQNPNKMYHGGPVYNNLRYRFNYHDKIFFGLTAEKDSGESFFSDYNKKGYDFYSYYIFLSNLNKIKSLAIGNYRASFGYGLVMNMGFSIGKYYSVSTINRTGRGLSKYSSSSESDYLQGLGITYQLTNRWNLSTFYSYRKIDANVDSMFIRTLKTDGYHRLDKDIEKKNAATNQLIGCNLDFNGKYVEYGLTAVYNFFNKELKPSPRKYNRYYPNGKDFFNIGMYYKFFMNKIIFAGETAIDKSGSMATFNSISYTPTVNTTFLLINRYYDKKYQSIYARGFGENTKTQNEAGLYLGLETNILRKFKLMCYGDIYYFPYLRYRVDKDKTLGGEGVFQLSYSHANSLNMLIKYSYKNKALNYISPSEKRYVLPYIRQRLHYQFNYSFNEDTSLKTFLEGICAGYNKLDKSFGILAGANTKFKLYTLPLYMQLGGAWFNTHDYSSKVYMYEPGLLYTFSSSSFYGKGFRSFGILKYEFRKLLMLQAKIGWTHYTDRDKIGSGLEEIQGNNKADFQVQLRLKW